MGELVRKLIDEGLVTAVHDVSDGGSLVAVAEMALAAIAWRARELRCRPGECSRGRCSARTRAIRRHDARPGHVERLAHERGRRLLLSIGSTGGDAIVIDYAFRSRLAKCPPRRPARRARGLLPQADGQRADAGVLSQAGYSGTPLAKKLSLKDDMRVWRDGMPASVSEEIAAEGLQLHLLEVPRSADRRSARLRHFARRRLRPSFAS